MTDLLDNPLVRSVRDIAQARHIPLLLVGGAVRDWLLGLEAHDLDFAVRGNAKTLARAVADALGGAYYLMDAERNTARVIVTHQRQAPFNLDFAVCRGETWDDDLFNRDFSVNAIALDLQTGTLMDPTGGRADLEQRIIRQVAPTAMIDDPVRALRALRIALALGASLDPSTAQAVRTAAAMLHRPSPERVRDELMKALALPDAAQAMRQFDTHGLLRAIVPEVEAMRDCEQSAPHQFPVLEHTFVVMEGLDLLIGDLQGRADHGGLPGALQVLGISDAHRTKFVEQLDTITTNDRTRAAVYRLAALLHDMAKPLARTLGEDGRYHFRGHEEKGAEMAARRAGALRLSGDEIDQVRISVRYHGQPNQLARNGVAGMTPRAVYRYMRATGRCAPEVALFCIADGYGKAGPQSPRDDMQRRGAAASLLIERYYTRYNLDVAPRPLAGGADVMALGVPQGRRVGEVLEAIREAQMIGEIHTRDEALALALQLAGQTEWPAS